MAILRLAHDNEIPKLSVIKTLIGSGYPGTQMRDVNYGLRRSTRDCYSESFLTCVE